MFRDAAPAVNARLDGQVFEVARRKYFTDRTHLTSVWRGGKLAVEMEKQSKHKKREPEDAAD